MAADDITGTSDDDNATTADIATTNNDDNICSPNDNDGAIKNHRGHRSNAANSRIVVQQRRQKIWVLLTRGMKGYEIARELNVSAPTITRDIEFLIADSQSYLNDMAKKTLPFMYKISIGGIQDIIKECWDIYLSEDRPDLNMSQRLYAMKLAKECHEAVFKLTGEGPSVMYLKQLQEKLMQIESIQGRQVPK